jgi:hypothetical protein
MKCSTIKSFFFPFGIGFFFKNIKYFAFIVKKMEKTHFLMNFQQNFLNFQMALDSIDVYQ